MDGWLGWLGTVQKLDRTSVIPCSFLKTGLRLFLTKRGVEGQTTHRYYAVRDKKSPGYSFIVMGEVSASFYVPPVRHLCVRYNSARAK